MYRYAPAIASLSMLLLTALVPQIGGRPLETNREFTVVDYRFELSLSSSKSKYVLGEPVALNCTSKYLGKKEIVAGIPGMGDNIEVLISKSGAEFESYKGPRWFLDDTMIATRISPGKSYSDTAEIIWNRPPPSVSHLSPEYARSALRGHIKGHFAFPDPGDYEVKLKLSSSGENLFSNAVPIQIESPTGQDLNIWNAFKENPDLAYFVQYGYAPDFNLVETAKLAKELEALLRANPSASAAESIKSRLKSYQAADSRRKQTR